MGFRTRIIRIGRFRGVRIPDRLLEQAGLSGAVEISVEGNRIVLQAADHPRRGWAEAFAAMARRGDDALLDPEASASEWDETEWQWQRPSARRRGRG